VVQEQINAALNQIRSILQQPGLTHADRLELEKVTTGLQKVLASHEKDRQAALGGNSATNHVARVLGGQAEGPAPAGPPGQGAGPGLAAMLAGLGGRG
jgi:hypothetical protein